MAEVGGMLASAVLGVVSERIGSAIRGQISLQRDFSQDLEKMEMTLQTVRAVLKDAERQSIREERVRLWLKRLKDAMYDISDMLDEFEGNTSKAAAPKLAVVIPCLPIVPRIIMANKMKMMRDKLKEIADEHKEFSLITARGSFSEQKVDDQRETTSNVGEVLIQGRTKEKLEIMACLSESINHQEDITILPIYGIGGIGKTTLAKLVYNNSRFINEFTQAWVYVSRTFDLKKIGNSIISQVSHDGTESNITERERINKRLEELLSGRKILIVLDDLWEKNTVRLDELRLMLKVNCSRVIVIVTTREESIAKEICTIEQPYKLMPLTDEMCWNIIKQKSAFNKSNDKERLGKIGMKIAEKCGGVALAAQSVGYLLKSTNYKEWESIRNSHIWSVSQPQDQSSPLASLLLSYDAMVPCLKLCFGYCALFPKGHKIDKPDLIHQWIALGFIESSNNQSPWKLSEDYIAQLLEMSFLQCSRLSSTASVPDQDDTSFTMHDLVHDVARSAMFDEVFDASEDNNTRDRNCRYALLTGCSKLLKMSRALFSKSRAMRFMDNTKLDLCDVAFSYAKYLRVLDLSECSIQRLPDSIGHFKLLRYLNAPGVQDQKIPKCITKLSKLIYLILRGSSAILTLPKSIGEMKGLMYLDLGDCAGIKELPRSLGKLEKLFHLDLSNCSCVTGVSELLESLRNLEYLNLSYCQNIGELPVALGTLSKLEYLNLSNCSYIEGRREIEVLGTLTTLEYFNLSSNISYIKMLPEAFSSFINLRYFSLAGFEKLEELPTSFGNLSSLMHLDLSHCSQAKDIPKALSGLTKLQSLNLSYCHNILINDLDIRMNIEAIGDLKKLQYLNLSGLLEKKYCGASIYISFFKCISTLSNLEHLDLSSNTLLESLPDCFGDLTKLRTLNLSGCSLLKSIPASIGKIDSLQFVHTNGCYLLDRSTLRLLNKSSISLPHFMVQPNDDGSSSNIVLLGDVNSPKLEISNLENVRSVKEVQIVKLTENRRIKQLKLEWTRGAERFLEDMKVFGALVPPSTLEEFEIQGYNCAKLPAWLMSIALHLPHLARITMESLPNCVSLPPLGQLPNLKALTIGVMNSIKVIDWDLCGGSNPFLRLQSFYLWCMESLEVWSTTYCCDEDGFSELMFPNLQELRIHACPKLRLTPCPPRAEKWEIFESDGVITSWAECAPDTSGASCCSSPRVTTLQVESCDFPLREWRLLHHLPALNGLSITCYIDLTISAEIISALFSLKSLNLTGSYVQTQAQLPGWLGQLTSLTKLEIRRFEVKASLEDIKHLTSLQELSLDECISMATLPQWVGYLNSLQELSISDCPNLNDLEDSIARLTSLKKLVIRSCDGIKFLPVSIEKLPKLENITIWGCPKLKRWCELDENKSMLSHVKEMIFW